MTAAPETTVTAPARYGAVLLAAGASTRLGQPKQLLPYQGQSLLRRAAAAAVAAVNGPVVVVLGAEAERMHPELAGLAVTPEYNAQWAEGMGASIRVGVEALLQCQPDVAGLILLLCDQPFVEASTLQALLQLHLQTGAPLAAAAYGDVLGVPAFFHQTFFGHLLACQGPGGARQLLAAHAPIVAPLPFPAGLLDIDTPADYQKLLVG